MRKYEIGSLFDKHKEWFYKATYLTEIESLIREKLSSKNLQLLENESELADFLFTHYWNNRFYTSLPKEEVLGLVAKCIDTYQFLLDSHMEPERIRCIFMKALMDVISLGSGTYFLFWDSWYNRYWRTRLFGCYRHYRGIGYLTIDVQEKIYWAYHCAHTYPSIKRHKYWCIFRFTFRNIREQIERKYPLLPDTLLFSQDFISRWGVGEQERGGKYFFAKQLLVSFSYPLFLLRLREKINVDQFEEEFFPKHKWCLERMSSCNPIFLNKYREEICREIALDLGLDPDPSYHRWAYFQNNPISPAKDVDFLDRVVSTVVNCFSVVELELFQTINAEKKIWTFKEQIKDRYYSKYPSLAPFQEIAEGIKNKVFEYKTLLKRETAEAIREMLFDEVESMAFVSKSTHLWNLEMMRNLKVGKVKAGEGVTKAVNLLLSLLPKNAPSFVSVKSSEKQHNLKEQLLARWRRAWLSPNLNEFQRYLKTMHTYTLYSISTLAKKSEISKVDLQAFVGEIDMFFLYPNRGRVIKKLFRRLDTGKAMGARMEKFRMMISHDFDNDSILWYRLVFVVACLWCVLMWTYTLPPVATE